MRVYRFAPDGASLQHVHTTPLQGLVPSAMAEFQGRLLVGCGRSVRLMECGKKKMLRKCEFAGLPSIVQSIHTMGSRIFVGDAHESFHFMRYKKGENAFYIYADDSTPRCAQMLSVFCCPLCCYCECRDCECSCMVLCLASEGVSYNLHDTLHLAFS